MTTVADNLAALGLIIPPLARPGGKYAPGVRSGNLLFLSGAIGTAFIDGKWSCRSSAS